MNQLKVVASGLAVFSVYLPLAIFVHRDYVQPSRPSGKAVEMVLKFELQGSQYATRSYVFSTARYPDTSSVRVYENLTPLPKENVLFTPDIGTYVIRFKTSDGSDPRTNGRQYWTVDP